MNSELKKALEEKVKLCQDAAARMRLDSQRVPEATDLYRAITSLIAMAVGLELDYVAMINWVDHYEQRLAAAQKIIDDFKKDV